MVCLLSDSAGNPRAHLFLIFQSFEHIRLYQHINAERGEYEPLSNNSDPVIGWEKLAHKHEQAGNEYDYSINTENRISESAVF